MHGTDLIAEWIDELQRQVRRRIERLSAEELDWRPDPGANPVGVTVWHFGRWLDFLAVCALGGRPQDEQHWFRRGWAERTGYDPRGLGDGGYGTLTGYTLGEVAAVPRLSAEQLLAYLGQACEALRAEVLGLAPDDLGTVASGSVGATVATVAPPFREPEASLTRLQWLTIILTGSFRHTGEIEALNAMRARLADSGRTALPAVPATTCSEGP